MFCINYTDEDEVLALLLIGLGVGHKFQYSLVVCVFVYVYPPTDLVFSLSEPLTINHRLKGKEKLDPPSPFKASIYTSLT